MKLPFKDGYKTTQKYGVNANYYKKFGLTGHEGIDIIPKTGDWTVHCLHDGVVVRDEDNPKSGAYGIFVTIWHPEIRKATQYCHLQANYVTVNQEVKQGQPLGTMGNTGNTTGAHLHLNLFEVDENGVRLNINNGFLGGINPKPFLEDIMATPEPGKVEVDSKVFEELVKKSTRYDEISADGYKTLDDIRSTVGQLEQSNRGYEETNRNLNTIITEKNNQVSVSNSKISTLEGQVLELETRVNSLTDQAKKVPELEKENDYLKERRELWTVSEKNLQKKIKRLESDKEALMEGSFKALIINWANGFKNWWKN